MDMLIDGKLMEKTEKIEIKNPVNNKLIDTVPHGNREDTKNAINAANRAAKIVKDVPSRVISENLYYIYEEVSKNSKIFEKLITLDSGKTIKDSREEVNRSLQTLLLSAEEAKRIYGETIPMDACIGGEDVIGFTTRIPLGDCRCHNSF